VAARRGLALLSLKKERKRHSESATCRLYRSLADDSLSRLNSLFIRSASVNAKLRLVLLGILLAAWSGCTNCGNGRPGSGMFNCLDRYCFCADWMNCHSCVNRQCHCDCQ
jgi:hypothetical protein